MSNSKKALRTRLSKENIHSDISSEDLSNTKKNIVRSICGNISDGLVDKYASLPINEAKVAAYVFTATVEQGLPDLIRSDVSVYHYGITDSAQSKIIAKRLKSVRSKEHIRICNSLGVYKGSEIYESNPKLQKMLLNITDNYLSDRERYRALESLRNPSNYAYLNRNRGLVSLGYSSYPQYLASKLWKDIRSKVLTRDKNLCRICGCKSTQVHHRSYDENVLRGEFTVPLVSLCEDCHIVIEFDEEGNKRDFIEVTRIANSLLSTYGGKKKHKTRPASKSDITFSKKLTRTEIIQNYPTLSERRVESISNMTLAGQVKAINKLLRNRRKKQNRRKASTSSKFAL